MRYYLVFGISWLLIGVALIGAAAAGYNPLGIDRRWTVLIGLLAMLRAAWMIARWWSSRTSARLRRPPEPPTRRPVEPAEYNPAFDFTRDEPK